MNKHISFMMLAAVAVLMFSSRAFAFKSSTYSLGIGYYSQNIFDTAGDGSGKKSVLGSMSLPVNLKYDWAAFGSWFLAPQLSYTLLPRKAEGNSADITLMRLVFLVGQNIGTDVQGGPRWDWYIGPGYLQETIKGKGGTKLLNNGTGTTTFAVPGATSTVRKVTVDVGSSMTWGVSRFGLDLILENLMSNDKRAASLMFSYAYVFGGSAL